jgi:vancomycin resistance protein YoaR
MDDLTDDVKNVVTDLPAKQSFPVLFKANRADLKPLAAAVKAALPLPVAAKVVYEDGQILVRHEVVPEELDTDQVPLSTMKVLPDGASVDLPMRTGTKQVPDEALDKVTDVVSSFSTRFPAYNHPRCSNIRLASSKLRGVILMPGDKFSFNGTVGRRTLRAGFKLAGVYKNGKHDVGIGGGICQVSTTLYNACLLADLKICQRSNHSLPVPYVPLGRDATVDYGDLDLIAQNTYDTPVAIDSHYETGRLTFRILGKKDPSISVKIIQAHPRSWDASVQTVVDHSLKPGTKRVVEKGSNGHSVTTYRLVFKDGQLIRRELLSHSTYGQQKRVIAYNPSAVVPSQAVGAVAPKIGG